MKQVGVPPGPGREDSGKPGLQVLPASPHWLSLVSAFKVSEANPTPSHPAPWFLLPEIEHPVKITYAQYEKYLKADNMIRTTAVCQVTDEPEVVVERDVILDNPTLTLEVKGC